MRMASVAWVQRSFKSTAESSGFERGYLVSSRLPLPMYKALPSLAGQCPDSGR